MGNSDCLFCRIASGDIKSTLVYESDDILAFRDINPQAPTHILIIPREHIPTTNDLEEKHAAIVGKMVLVARNLAEKEGLADDGYRLVFNCNQNAGQAVFHIHLHLLGGRRFSWPPG
ncbi:histidine triad nucleotide-binding protein [Candidatus Sumerlaeota bacterium]|nr:histidine triad nucleotide-binding protein [Candidatus Sumerlaeota bacterium]